jgi:Fe-S cluster biogenesis protein NfuA
MSSDSIHQEKLYAEVKAALDKIRPYLEADGGDVKIVEITDEKVVMIELLGACGSCPMSTLTMKAGVEETIKREVPEIKSVEAINITPLEYL